MAWGVQISGLLAFTLTMMTVNSQLDDDNYIVEVSAFCPPFTNETAEVKVVTDIASTQPFAVCSGGKTFDLIKDDAATFKLGVEFVGLVDRSCVFYKKQGVQTYTVSIYVPASDGIFLFDKPPHVVTCIYDPYGSKATNETVFAESPVNVEEIQENVGGVSKSTISLYVADIFGRPITTAVPLGKVIMLVADMQGDYVDEVGLQTVTCTASGGGNTYSLIIAGCGDGVVFKDDQGFVTKGKKAKSPYFRSFRLSGSNIVTYDCGFAICKQNCDGSSCTKARKRRDISSDDDGYHRSSGGAFLSVRRELWSPEDDMKNMSAHASKMTTETLPLKDDAAIMPSKAGQGPTGNGVSIDNSDKPGKKSDVTEIGQSIPFDVHGVHGKEFKKTGPPESVEIDSSESATVLQKLHRFLRCEALKLNLLPLILIVILLSVSVVLYMSTKALLQLLETRLLRNKLSDMPKMPLDI